MKMRSTFLRLGRSLALGVGLSAVAGAVAGADEPIKIGIAQFGEAPQLVQAVEGFKAELAEAGYHDGVNVKYVQLQINFETNLIPQMIGKLKSEQPKLILTSTTPVSQGAKALLKGADVPIFFTAVTDPVKAGLIPAWDKAGDLITGASDLQNLDAVVGFTRKLMPKATRFAVAYNPGEDNDVAQVALLEQIVGKHGFTLVKLGIDNPTDVPIRVSSLRGKADVLYAPASSLVQSSISAVGAAAKSIGLPLISSSQDAVAAGLAFASYEVSYDKVGRSTAKLAVRHLKGEPMSALAPIKPLDEDHFPMIHKKLVKEYGLTVPGSMRNCGCFVE